MMKRKINRTGCFMSWFIVVLLILPFFMTKETPCKARSIILIADNAEYVEEPAAEENLDEEKSGSGEEPAAEEDSMEEETLETPAVKLSNKKDGIKISWDKIEGAAGYHVMRKGPDGRWKKLKTTKGLSWVDASVKENKLYCYGVEAYSADTKSSFVKNKSIKRVAPKPFESVPINKLANYASLSRGMTESEFKKAYDKALKIVAPLSKYGKKKQLQYIAWELRELFENGIEYSDSDPHYADAYGYFVSKKASCAGCARATGLCLNILGYSYEHVNENQWSHQWCRVKVGKEYWICDAYGLYAGPEPEPYKHPYL